MGDLRLDTAYTPVSRAVVDNHPPPISNEKLSPAARVYTDIVLPVLCQRYANLPLSRNNWFVELLATRDEDTKERRHCTSHGLIQFVDLARIVATNYWEVDVETKAFVNEVALRIAMYNHDLDSEKMKVCEERTSFLTHKGESKAQQDKEEGKKMLKNDPSKKEIGKVLLKKTTMTQRLPSSQPILNSTVAPSMLVRPTLHHRSFSHCHCLLL